MSPGTLGACGSTRIERSSVTCKISMRNTTAVGTTTEDPHVRTCRRGTSSLYLPARNPHVSETPILSWHTKKALSSRERSSGRDTSCACGSLLSAGLEQGRAYGIGCDCVCGAQASEPADPGARSCTA